MIETSIIHTTPTAQIKINVKGISTFSKDLTLFENKQQFEYLCQIGCPNFENKWACPPFSPTYTEYSLPFNYIYIILFYCELDQFHYTKTEYMKVKAANSVLKSKLDKFLRKLEPVLNGKMLSNGSCRLCKPCTAKVKKSGCKRPKEMRFSLEALGLDVNRISQKYFDHTLLWYKNKQAPQYTSVIGCLLTNQPIDETILDNHLLNFTCLKSQGHMQQMPLLKL